MSVTQSFSSSIDWDANDFSLSSQFSILDSVSIPRLPASTPPARENREIEETMRQIKLLYAVFDGTSYDYEKVQRVFEQAFDKGVVARTYPNPMLGQAAEIYNDDYSTLCHSFHHHAQSRTRMYVQCIQVRSNGTIEYSVQASSRNGLEYHNVTLDARATTRNGKIVRLEQHVL